MSYGEGKILALDIGSVRVGLAVADYQVRLAHPVGALDNDSSLVKRLAALCTKEGVTHLVIGLPRGLEGQDTTQTKAVRQFGAQLAASLKLPFSWQDEALTSVQAEAELKSKHKSYTKEDIDALAATYILEDYLREPI